MPQPFHLARPAALSRYAAGLQCRFQSNLRIGHGRDSGTLVRWYPVAGGHMLRWTAMDVRKKDGSPHHGVGIHPTVPVGRTLAGVIAGRDELLEKGIEVVSQP